MFAPFVWLFVCFAAGIVASIHWHLVYLAAFLSIIPAALSLRSRFFHLGILAQGFFFFILGWSHSQLQIERYESSTLKQEVRFREQETLAVKGSIIRAPEISDDFFVLQVHVRSLAGRPVDGIARITVSGAMSEDLFTGDEIETFARFRLPANFGTPGAFNYRLYLAREGIHAVGSVKSAVLIHKVARHTSLGSFTSRMRLFLIREISRELFPDDADTLRALWLDDRSGLSKETEQELIDAGIFHVIAISGFHVAVLIGIAFFALRRYLPYRHALLIISILLLIYFLLLEGRSSITRSFLTFLIFAFAFWRHEAVNWPTVLFLSAFTQVAINPLQLFDTGYHLTYLSTAAIVFVAAPLASKIHLPRKIYRYFVDFLITMLCIQFTLLPYQAYVFHKVPFGGVLANFVAIPLSSVLIGIAPFVLPVLGVFHPAKMLIHGVLKMFFAASGLFSGIWLKVVATPSLWILFLFYLCLSMALIDRRKVVRTASILTCFFSITLILWLHPPPAHNGLRVHIIDVGQGDSILLQYPDGTADLIDSGGFWNAEALDVGTSILLPYLSSLDITRLHRVFLTHAHADHMSGFLTLLRYIPCDEFYVTRQPLADYWFQTLIATLPIPLHPIHKGEVFRQGDTVISVLAPSDSAKSLHVRNDDSLVMLAEFHGARILLTGDAEKITEEQLCEMPDIHADYLKVAHHGSKTSTATELLRKVKPKAAFISVGRNNWFGHPNAEVLSRLRHAHTMIYRTDQLGTIILTIESNAAEISAYAWTN